MPGQKLASRSYSYAPPKALNAFLNIPYDEAFQSLYLAYIAGITAFGCWEQGLCSPEEPLDQSLPPDFYAPVFSAAC